MDLSERIEAFAKLGDYLKENLLDPEETFPSSGHSLEMYFKGKELLVISKKAREANPWFIPEFIFHALRETAKLLEKSNLEKWTVEYPAGSLHPGTPFAVGVILAGNIPLVGFHDFLSVLLSGHRFIAKMSGKDDKILPFLAGKLLEFQPGFTDYIHFEDSYLREIDAVIATGSNNSSRYFEHYFGKYPHIFRKNRNGIAILTGQESADELALLADDVFLYFGMGCRNIAKIYVPQSYVFNGMFEAMENYKHIIDHNKYANNYQYHRSVYLMNRVEHLDNGFLLLRADPVITSPVSTLHYEYYTNPAKVASMVLSEKDAIQCIAGAETPGLPTIKFGSTQHPGLWDYADNVDTLKFLSNLYEN